MQFFCFKIDVLQRLTILTTPYADTVHNGTVHNGMVVSESGAVRLTSAVHTPTTPTAPPAPSAPALASGPALVWASLSFDVYYV